MRESILDVLLYLFEHYFSDDSDLVSDRDTLQKGLIEAGFSPSEVSRAFDWLDELANERPPITHANDDACPVRVFSSIEVDRISSEGVGFLMFLQQAGVIDAKQRELVLDQAMALNHEDLDLDDLKWVVLMVLFNQPGAEAAYAWMESQMFDEAELVH